MRTNTLIGAAIAILGLAVDARADSSVPEVGAGGESGARGRSGLAGRWRFEGDVVGDGCAGQIVLYTGDFTIDPPRAAGGAWTLHAEPRDRTYRLRFAGDDVIVEGTYPDRDCPGRTFSERWVLRMGGDTLHGRLATSWLRTPMCRGMCTVDFRIRATRVR